MDEFWHGFLVANCCWVILLLIIQSWNEEDEDDFYP